LDGGPPAWLAGEPAVVQTLAHGASIVTFSGDKLLGGPQAGLVVGRADLIAKLRKHPLKRALRVGKLTLAALEPVLALYRSPEFLLERLTTLKWLTRPATQMHEQAVRLRPVVQRAVGAGYEVTDAPMVSQIGSGALPVDLLPSHGLAIRLVKNDPSSADRSARGASRERPAGGRASLDRLEGMLRGLPRPVIARVADKTLWLDLRCLDPADEAAFVAQWGNLRS
jgi:L-seryl-tRNA(Ser) seleniumtransferase